MNFMILRKAFSEIAKKNDFPWGTLIVVVAVVAVIILLIYLFRNRIDEFLRISDAESFVNKKGTRSIGTSSSRTQSTKAISDDPEKTTNMKTVNLPKKASKKETK